MLLILVRLRWSMLQYGQNSLVEYFSILSILTKSFFIVFSVESINLLKNTLPINKNNCFCLSLTIFYAVIVASRNLEKMLNDKMSINDLHNE